jgi:hypothetical protein
MNAHAVEESYEEVRSILEATSSFTTSVSGSKFKLDAVTDSARGQAGHVGAGITGKPERAIRLDLHCDRSVSSERPIFT